MNGERSGRRRRDTYVPSLLAAIGDVIERHMIEISFLPPKRERLVVADRKLMAAGDGLIGDQRLGPAGMRQCPKCGRAALIHLEGCDQCTNCDYSKCW